MSAAIWLVMSRVVPLMLRGSGGFVARLAPLAFGLWLMGLTASAHTASTAWLSLQVDGARIEGTWDIAIRDVDLALSLDANADGRVTWGEVRQKRQAIETWVADGLDLRADGIRIPMQIRSVSILEVTGVPCLHLEWLATAREGIRKLSLIYGLLFELDRMHRGLVRVMDAQHPAGTSAVLGPEDSLVQFEPGSVEPGLGLIRRFIGEGVHHIATGYDHLLFLLVLLLPTVVVRGAEGWIPASGGRRVLMRVLQTVTAFTLAHSVTLALAALEWIRPPSQPVEVIIALSIVFTALGNLGRGTAWSGSGQGRVLETLESRPWVVPFCFGLVHGFGFADGLRGLGLTRWQLVTPLVGFNLGVELGQLAAVLLVLPLLWKLGRTGAYRRWGLAGASLAIALLACVWVVDRAAGMHWFDS